MYKNPAFYLTISCPTWCEHITHFLDKSNVQNGAQNNKHCENVFSKFLPDWEEKEAVLLLGPGGSKISLYLDTIKTDIK